MGHSGAQRDDVHLEQMLRAVVAATREAVAVLTPDGRVMLTNPAHDALFGRKVHTWQGDYRDLWSTTAQETIDRELADGEARDSVLDGIDANGRCFPVWRRPDVVRDDAGRVLYHIAVLHDHSAQRRADQAKSRFLAAASHDLRQPLQALTMFVSVLSGRDHGPANRKVIDRIEEALAATDAQISSLVEISKLEAGVVVPATGPVRVARVLAHLAEEARSQTGTGTVDLRLVPSSAVIFSDGALLERLLRPLLANAVRFAGQGRILVGCRRCGDAVRIEVWDNGPGIPEDQLGAIFHEFHRLAPPDRHQGLGLGLAIVDRLGRLLGHAVTVQSRLGKGSVFAVHVPLARDAQRDG